MGVVREAGREERMRKGEGEAGGRKECWVGGAVTWRLPRASADEPTLGPSLAPLCLLIMAFDSSPRGRGRDAAGRGSGRKGGRVEGPGRREEPRLQNKKPK